MAPDCPLPGGRLQVLLKMDTTMNLRRFAVYVALAASTAAACTSPTKPAGSVTLTTGNPVSPGNGAQIANLAQPVKLTISNAIVTSASAAVSYTFEVATDSAFASKVQTKEAAQTVGQTAVTLDTLAAGRVYYWRVRTTGGDTVGTFTTALSFTIGAAIVIQAPAPASPTNGATSVPLRPTLTVTNASRSGPVGSLSYRFEISTSNTFGTILTSGTVSEGNNQTSFTPSAELGITSTYFWRAQVVDTTNNITSAFSNAATFTTLFRSI